MVAHAIDLIVTPSPGRILKVERLHVSGRVMALLRVIIRGIENNVEV